MPRKKKAASQPLGELLGIRELSKNDRQSVVQTFDNLPKLYYVFLCQTVDQERAFRDIKLGFQFIKADMQDGRIDKSNPNFLEMTGLQRTFWGLMADRYLAWYRVTLRGWEHLESSWSADESLQGLMTDTPLAAWIRMIELEADGFMEPAFSERSRFAPSQHRKWVELEVAEKHGRATKQQKAKIETDLLSATKKMLPTFGFGQLYIEICRKAAARDERLKLSLKNYDAVMAALDTNIQSLLHPRKNMKGYAVARRQKISTRERRES